MLSKTTGTALNVVILPSFLVWNFVGTVSAKIGTDPETPENERKTSNKNENQQQMHQKQMDQHINSSRLRYLLLQKNQQIQNVTPDLYWFDQVNGAEGSSG